MSKNRKYPILEFDDSKKAFIDPSHVLAKYGVHDFPSKLIVCFFREVIDSMVEKKEITPLVTIQGENLNVFYKFVDKNTAIIQGIIGSPACAGQVEEGIALGAKKIMFCGGAGSLDKSVTIGKIVIPAKAIRDEGTSYHYMRPSKEASMDLGTVKAISDYLIEKNIEFIIGKTWTTDAFYRETPLMIKRRKRQGAIIVEMEQAALLAISKFRNIKYGALIYGGDDLSGDKWDTRLWRNKIDIRTQLVDYCKELVELI